MCLPNTLGENLGGGHFYLAERGPTLATLAPELIICARGQIQISPIAFSDDIPADTPAVPGGVTVGMWRRFGSSVAQAPVVIVSYATLKPMMPPGCGGRKPAPGNALLNQLVSMVLMELRGIRNIALPNHERKHSIRSAPGLSLCC
jgi:hypothetical protein